MGTQLENPTKVGGFATSIRPGAALIAGARFLMDMESTRHLFTLFDAVDGKQNERNYQRYLATEIGARLDRENVNFADILLDEGRLREYPQGSLADCLLKFLSAENLKTELILLAEKDAQISTLNLDPSRRNYIASGFAIHDLLHVITGYGRDPIGETCLLSYTAEQLNFRGLGGLARMLALREQASHPAAPVLRAVKEAREIARDAIWMPEIDWREYFGEPIDLVRDKLGVTSPDRYFSLKRELTAEGDKADPRPELQNAA